MGVLTRLSGNLGGMGHNQNIVLNFPAFRVQMQGNNIQTIQIRLNEEGNSSMGHNMLIGNNLPFDMDRETVGETGNQGTSQIGPFCSTKVLQNLNQGLSPMLRPLLLSGLPSSTPMSENWRRNRSNQIRLMCFRPHLLAAKLAPSAEGPRMANLMWRVVSEGVKGWKPNHRVSKTELSLMALLARTSEVPRKKFLPRKN